MTSNIIGGMGTSRKYTETFNEKRKRKPYPNGVRGIKELASELGVTTKKIVTTIASSKERPAPLFFVDPIGKRMPMYNRSEFIKWWNSVSIP